MQNLTSGPPTRRIILFSIPLLFGNLFQQVYSFTDAAVVGRMMGMEALAAVGSSGSIIFLLIGFSWGASAGLAIPVSRSYGAGDMKAMRTYVAAGALVSVAIALFITVSGLLFARDLLSLLNTPAEILDYASTYLTVLFAGSAATVAYNFYAATLRALGDSRTPLIFLIAASVLNAALVWLFLGPLNMGIAGAAWSTIAAQAASVACCFIYVGRKVPALHLTREDWRRAPGAIGESLRTGLPMGFQMSIIAIGAVILQFSVNGLGTESVAAFTAAMRVDQMAVMPLNSFGIAMVTYVAQNRGARQWLRIRTGVFRMTLVACSCALVLGGLTIIFARPLAAFFVGAEQTQVLDQAATYFYISGALYAVLATLFIVRNAVQGLGISWVPTLGGALELAARGGAALLLVPAFGFLGAAMAAPLAWIAAIVPAGLAWLHQRRKLMELEDGHAMTGSIRQVTFTDAEGHNTAKKLQLVSPSA